MRNEKIEEREVEKKRKKKKDWKKLIVRTLYL